MGDARGAGVVVGAGDGGQGAFGSSCVNEVIPTVESRDGLEAKRRHVRWVQGQEEGADGEKGGRMVLLALRCSFPTCL